MKRADDQYQANEEQTSPCQNDGKLEDKSIYENEVNYQLVFKYAPIGLMYFYRDGVINFCNDSFAAMMGSSREILQGLNLLMLPEKKIVRMVENVLKGEISAMEGKYISVTGQKKITARMNLQPIMDSDGQVIGGFGIIEDITQRSQYEQRLQYLSQRDPITGLYNRGYFEQQLDMLNASLFKERIAIGICDIDNLKLINDTMGHLTGDRLLKATAEIITGSCSPDAIVARIGGDEFAVLLPAGSQEEMARLQEQLLENIEQHSLTNPDIPISLSFGYAVSQENRTDLKVLMREADLCMYQQKVTQRQRNREYVIQIFLQKLKSIDAFSLERSIRLREYLTVFCSYLSLSEAAYRHILNLADYHDIGRAIIKDQPDDVRSQEIKLSELDIRKHCETGYRILLAHEDTAILAHSILAHHEHWDGSGYPLGIKGEEIPLECRVFAVADAYDDIISRQTGVPDQEQAIKILQDLAGEQLDPKLTGIFIGLIKDKLIKTIW